jgi:SAM-dependent methyltransferase
MSSLPTVDVPCAVCGNERAQPVWTTPDRAFAIPGLFTVVRCRDCGFLYQRPRVRSEHLARCYPEQYPRHQEPHPRVPFKGSAMRIRAVRCALAGGLGYARFRDDGIGFFTRLWARTLLRRLRWSCPPWVGAGRYLDVGCGSGAGLGVARALGWQVTGIEVDEFAARKARQFTDELYVGDVLEAPFVAARFDLVTAFHVLEHVVDPVAVVRRMVDWLAPGGLLVVEVPNAGGLGAAFFGRAWSGLELPRHLSHFTPETLERTVRAAGGRVIWCWHQAKPRYYLRSFSNFLRDRGSQTLTEFVEWRPAYGVLKLFLELILPLVSLAGRGEVIRIGAARN